MAKTVFLTYGTRNLDKARKLASQIKKGALSAARLIKDKVERRSAQIRIREAARQNSAAIREASDRGRLRDRARRINRARRGAARRNFTRFGEFKDNLVAAAEGNVQFQVANIAARSLSALPILGPAVDLLWENFGRPFLTGQFEALARKQEARINRQLEEIRREQLVERFELEPEFRDRIAAESRAQDRALEQAVLDRRWSRSSALAGLE